MAAFEIIRETEAASGWMFDAQIIDAEGDLRSTTMSLSWADYNLWSRDGADPPAVVAEAALAWMISTVGLDAIKQTFDASIARRMSADADIAIPTLIANRLP